MIDFNHINLHQLLSPREKEVLTLHKAGYTNHGIAEELHISYLTVNTHLTNIWNKTGIPVDRRYSRTAILLNLAHQQGF